MRKGFFAVAISLLLMLSAAGLALGAPYAYGSKVGWTASDLGNPLLPMAPPVFENFDVDVSGTYNAIDPVYADTFWPIPDRLTFFDGCAPGRQVVFGNADFGMPLTIIPTAALVYLPLYGDPTIYNPADPIYLAWNSANGVLQTNDIRISPDFGVPGTKVTDASKDHGIAYNPIPLTWTFQYVDRDLSTTYSIGDWIYLHTTFSPFVTAGDIRFTEH